MRRAAAALGAAALIALIAAPVPGSASDGCSSWKRHTKRVVKHVKRHGKVRRVVRVKHWWTCRQPVAPETGGGTPKIPGGGPESPTEPGSSVGHLSVKSKEYDYVLSRPTVSPGEVIVELNNQGEDPHNLNLQLSNGQGPEYSVPEAASQKRELGRFTLPAGTYRLWCSLEGHEQLGMKATLIVG